MRDEGVSSASFRWSMLVVTCTNKIIKFFSGREGRRCKRSIADYQLNRSGLLCYSALSLCTLAGPVVVTSLKRDDSCLDRLHLQRTEELATLDVHFTTKRPSAGAPERRSGFFAPKDSSKEL